MDSIALTREEVEGYANPGHRHATRKREVAAALLATHDALRVCSDALRTLPRYTDKEHAAWAKAQDALNLIKYED